MRTAALALLVIGGLVTAAGVVLGVLNAPEGESIAWVPFAIGLGLGTLMDVGGIALLVASRRG